MYRVETSSGSVVTTRAVIYLVSPDAKIVITDIDGTVTRSDVRGLVLPALGLSDWKHNGVVQLYNKVGKFKQKMVLEHLVLVVFTLDKYF